MCRDRGYSSVLYSSRERVQPPTTNVNEYDFFFSYKGEEKYFTYLRFMDLFVRYAEESRAVYAHYDLVYTYSYCIKRLCCVRRLWQRVLVLLVWCEARSH